jgi:hypothetical protein
VKKQIPSVSSGNKKTNCSEKCPCKIAGAFFFVRTAGSGSIKLFPMKLTRLLLPSLMLATYTSMAAQARWDGGGGDGLWTNPANWAGNLLPGPADDVILDNTFITGSYMVRFPAGSSIVTVRSLAIMPGTGYTIEVVLPSANTANNAFTVNKTGYGLMIYEGGIFRNASGVSSGETLQISDSLIIYNGGKYVHQNRGGHANTIVRVLSKKPGTESGAFEFNIPTSSSYALSLSTRTYGQLILSSEANGNTVTYSAISVNPIIINSDLKIGARVRLSLDASDTLLVKGQFIHEGNTLNLSSSARALVMAVKGNWTQAETAIITETGTTSAEILLAGTSQQTVECKGAITGSVAVKLNNPAGIVLQDTLALPYKLTLLRGKLTTSAIGLLTLQSGCTIVADSLSNNSFVNGPMRKEGLSTTSQFLLPVGKGNTLRWLSLMQATGSYTVEFFRANPRLMSSTYGTDIHHISSIEHWSVEADRLPAAQAQVKLSFNDPNSGGVTNLAALRVAQYTGGDWVSRGNSSSAGTPGSNGFVSSNTLNTFTTATRYFALASSAESFNPLYTTTGYITMLRPNNTAPTFVLAPSITTGNTRLLLTTEKKSKMQVIITDLQGRMVQTGPAYLQAGMNSILINTSTFRAGVYQVSVCNERGLLNTLRLTKL